LSERKHPILFALMIIALVVVGLAFLRGVFTSALDGNSLFRFGKRIGVIPIRGSISDSREVVEQLIKYRQDDRIKAIIVRIDSPGGSTAASQEIYQEIKRTRTKKKVVASMGNVAASGGYYVALGADKIVADPGTLTGSIGVIMELANIQELLHKIGVSSEAIKSGPYKDIGSPFRKIKPEERRILEEVILNVRHQFVDVVMKERGLTRDQVEKIADGRIFSGEQAKALGLIDELGGFEDAVELSKKMVGLKGEIKLIYPEKKRISLWDILFKSLIGEIKQSLSLEWPASQFFSIPPMFYKN
jgi:protease IV